MKITFVHLGRENLGIQYLSSLLKKAGHQTCLAYDPGLFGPEDNVFYIPLLEKVFNQKEKVIEKIENSNPDLVAFSAYTSTYPWVCDIARIIKEKMEVKTVFGGIHATLVPEVVIKNDFVDFVIVGEGEYAMLDLVEALSSKEKTYDTENLWHKKDGRVIKNRLRPPIQDLATLPLPDKELFEKDINYRDDYMIMTSRGCVFNCSYCCESFNNKLYHNRFYRRRGVDSIIEELKGMKKKYNFREVMFFDALFFTDKTWLRELLKRYKKEIGVPFRCPANVTYFDREAGRLLKEAGCYSIDFGMQTLNENLKRDVLNRHETNNCAKEAFLLCDRLQLHYDIDHMFGLPGEREGDHILGAQFYSQFRYLNRIKCFNLTYFPRMEILKSAREEGFLNEKDITDIEEGRIGDFFHRDSLKDKAMMRTNKNFQVLYKILPILPGSCVRYILRHKIYRKFYLIPSFMVIFLQLLVALRGRDYRYFFFLRYYFLRIRKNFFEMRHKSKNTITVRQMRKNKIPRETIERAYAVGRQKKPWPIFGYKVRARIVADAAKRYLGETSCSFRILDFGSAEGLALLELRSLLPSGIYVGVECSDEMFRYVPNLPSDTQIVKGDITNLPEIIKDESYDIVSALALLEHLPRPIEAVREAARVLRPGGIFVATCPVPFWDAVATCLGLGPKERHIAEMNRKRMTYVVRKTAMEVLTYEQFMWAPIAALTYLKIPVSPSFSLSLDRVVRGMKIFNFLFVNQCVIARKPL